MYYNIVIYYYYHMGPPSYMRSVVDRSVVMRRMTVLFAHFAHILYLYNMHGSYKK